MTRSIRPGPERIDGIVADIRATIGRLKAASSERVLRLGISMAQLNILYTLQRNGEVTMSRLAEVLNVSLSNASGLIDRMEERGLVERIRDAEDRRVVRVRLAVAGADLLVQVDAVSDDLLRNACARIDDRRLGGLALAARDLRVAIDESLGPCPPLHVTSTATPRSSATIRGVATTTPPGKD